MLHVNVLFLAVALVETLCPASNVFSNVGASARLVFFDVRIEPLSMKTMVFACALCERDTNAGVGGDPGPWFHCAFATRHHRNTANFTGLRCDPITPKVDFSYALIS